MPVFFQHQINDTTRLGIWKIEETEEFFKANVPQHRDVTHPHKRLQHLAGRFLLQFLFPDFPYDLIQIADTRKPFLPDERYHFSISHCGDYAAAMVSSDKRVGVDIELVTPKIETIKNKFLSKKELLTSHDQLSTIDYRPDNYRVLTLLWSAKECVFKWYGDGGVDFKDHIQLRRRHEADETIECFFAKTQTELSVHYRQFDHLVLAWVAS
ncbi:MAG TPA: 4'-phosphopantetheinyl transferase superfamily protein [Chitinophagaceae bacterium]|nr:4'-phosphopantetheinyl transferase superfamily protein [Chitinophagaceae bacterium]